jgi:hypothetical protein
MQFEQELTELYLHQFSTNLNDWGLIWKLFFVFKTVPVYPRVYQRRIASRQVPNHSNWLKIDGDITQSILVQIA